MHVSISDGYLRLVVCKGRKSAEMDCTGNGPTALYGPSNGKVWPTFC